MGIGILLGNLVPSTGPTLQKGQFVGVSVPIGKSTLPVLVMVDNTLMQVSQPLAFWS
jgi:ACR3 family arsenite efflux pump ArsB